jgi:hypothetical protein
MPPCYVALGRSDNLSSLRKLQEYFCIENPGYRLACRNITSPEEWFVQGISYFWLEEGQIEVKMNGVWSAETPALASTQDQWQPLEPGDVLVLDSDHSAKVRGKGRFWEIFTEKLAHTSFAGLRRLRYLTDQSGGCNVSQNAFRRLQITWKSEEITPSRPNGNNVLGCHVVYIAKNTSRTHYHPPESNQHELYFVLNPTFYNQKVTTKKCGVWTYPQPGDWERYNFTPLKPGDIFSIKAGVVHRAVDVLACVVAIPGFKPNNDIYVDHLISQQTNGRSPHNDHFIQTPQTAQVY